MIRYSYVTLIYKNLRILLSFGYGRKTIHFVAACKIPLCDVMEELDGLMIDHELPTFDEDDGNQ